MNEPKPFASLSSSLLARKGAARPAMRPQLQAVTRFHDLPDQLPASPVDDDLGWNDMGHDETVHEAAPLGEILPIADVQAPVAAPVPEVVRQQEAIARKVAVVEPVRAPLASIARRSALADGRRAAFTLRVDAERHLKLRLACTIRNRSAQQLVTEALDRLIDELPEVSTLAAQVASGSRKTGSK